VGAKLHWRLTWHQTCLAGTRVRNPLQLRQCRLICYLDWQESEASLLFVHFPLCSCTTVPFPLSEFRTFRAKLFYNCVFACRGDTSSGAEKMFFVGIMTSSVCESSVPTHCGWKTYPQRTSRTTGLPPVAKFFGICKAPLHRFIWFRVSFPKQVDSIQR